jgi:mRNA interferase HigB
VNIIAKGTLLYYIYKYPKAKTALLTWYYEFAKAAFSNFNELKQVYGNASILQNSRVIFNIKGNDFRLLIAVNFRKQAAYIIWFGTHKEYDKINAETISFDTGILNHKTK